jgi:hypothetical protein
MISINIEIRNVTTNGPANDLMLNKESLFNGFKLT